MFSPIIIMLVAKTINKKILVISIIASIFIIVLVTHSYFGSNDISLITQDLKEINKDYNFKEFIAGEDQALVLASHSWTKSPRIIWWEDYQLSIQNKTVYREYSIETKPTFDQSQILEITTKLKRSGNQTFEGVPLILINDQSAPQIPPENFKLLKCYNILCVYSQD